jgi:hypothetical protein
MSHVGLRMLGVVFLGVTALVTTPIEARENEGDEAKVSLPQETATAERQAEDGDLNGAVASILAAEPRISNASAGLRPDQDRALRIAARIIARADRPPFPGFPSDDEETKWAYLQARKLKDAGPTASLLTDFGEIASRIPTERRDALSTLEDLEDRNVMASAFGYAALARMRAEAFKDSAAVAGAPLRALAAGKRQVAVMRCHRMTRVAPTCDKGLIPVNPPKN